VADLDAAAQAGRSAAAPIDLAAGVSLAFPVAADSRVSIDGHSLPLREACELEAALRDQREVLASKTLKHAGAPRWATLDNVLDRPAELHLSLKEGRLDACSGVQISSDDLGQRIAVHRRRERPKRAQRPNIFIYSVDTLRADAVDSGLRDGVAAPSIQSFARDAVRWRTAISPSSWTLPAVASLLTGVSPARHGVLRWDHRLAPGDLPTIAEILGGQGYHTVAISHSWIVGADYGLDRGFDDFFMADHFNGTELRSQDARQTLRAWLLEQREGDRPLFAFIHTVDPHGPYSPPAGTFSQAAESIRSSRIGAIARLKDLQAARADLDEHDLAKVRALYQGEVAFADYQFGRFLDLLRSLDLYDDSIIALVSDHGEEFLEHGGFDHGRTLYREVIQVPMLVRFPGGVGAGREIAAPTSTIDLAATIAAAAGAAIAGLDGADLRRFLEVAPPPQRTVFMDLVPNLDQDLEPTRMRAAIVGSSQCLLTMRGRGPTSAEWRSFRIGPVWEETSGEPLTSEVSSCRATLLAELRRESATGAKGETWSPDEETLKNLRAVGYIQ